MISLVIDVLVELQSFKIILRFKIPNNLEMDYN